MLPLLVLFDIDGTLIDTAGAGRRAIERAFEQVYGVDATKRPRDGVRYAGMTDPIIFRNVARARANGYRAVAVESGWVPRADLEQAGPDALFTDLSDLPTVLPALGLEAQ